MAILENGQAFRYGDIIYRTSQDWYDRFARELDKPVVSDHLMCGLLVCADHATAAAKKAAGIE